MEHIRSKQADSIVHMDDAMADMVKGASEAKDKINEEPDEALISIAQDERNDVIPKK
jgi:hypothetical protein